MSTLVFLVLFVPSITTLCYGRPMEQYRAIDDVLINDAVTDNTVPHMLPKNGELFEGDIIMDSRLRNAIWGRRSKRVSRTFDGSLTWPNGTIPYVYDEDFPLRNKQLLKEAFNEYERRTCIRFKKRQNENDFVIFTAPNSGHCSSYIGKLGGAQVVNLGRKCLIIGSFKHEIMHALGILHEQSRPDDYVDVLYENIDKAYWDNFHKYKIVDNIKGEFNYASIMLYPNKAFSNNGHDTIDAIGDPELRFGQRDRFSIGDVKEINQLYNCKKQLQHPNYAGLYGEYQGNAKRKEIVERRKHLTNTTNFKLAPLNGIFPERKDEIQDWYIQS